MATGPSELYPAIAQIAAVFAGFGSLASGLGQRRGGDDARIDAYRFGFMLFSSLATTLLGLLPGTLAGLLGAEGSAIRLSAAAAVAALLIYAPLSTVRIVRIRHVSGFNLPAGIANGACALIALAAFGLCVFGWPADRIAGLYLVGLMALLGSSVVMFSRVIASMLRPHSTAGDPGP
jgi:hypothetical protein